MTIELANQLEGLIEQRGMRIEYDFNTSGLSVFFGYGDDFKETGFAAMGYSDLWQILEDCIDALQNWDSNITNNL